MNPSRPLTGALPYITAFVIWFAHFMLCWAAVEIWPLQWQANVADWVFTAAALLALGGRWLRSKRSEPHSDLSGWSLRLGRGATALAGLAVVFTAIPSLVFVP